MFSFGGQNIPFPTKEGIIKQEQIDKYYPNILDTVKDKRIIVAQPIQVKKDCVLVSILKNTGTYEQMFLCTHSLNHKLLDTYYIGKATMWDGSSHTIEYKIVNDTTIRFIHVNYYSVQVNGEYTIDTLKSWNYKLTFLDNGKIIKK
jgi:hypothetical protein